MFFLLKFHNSGQFLAQNLGFYDECSMIFYFFENSPSLESHIFFSTQPILKNLDVLKSHWSESFISAILVAQSKIRVPHDAHLWRVFWKNTIHSPTKGEPWPGGQDNPCAISSQTTDTPVPGGGDGIYIKTANLTFLEAQKELRKNTHHF